MAERASLVQRLMGVTGKLRAVMGPADVGNIHVPVAEISEDQRRQHSEQMAQFEVQKLPNGQVYLVNKDTTKGINGR